jgi:hypothetical protein
MDKAALIAAANKQAAAAKAEKAERDAKTQKVRWGCCVRVDLGWPALVVDPRGALRPTSPSHPRLHPCPCGVGVPGASCCGVARLAGTR